jgi:hypothetical protein
MIAALAFLESTTTRTAGGLGFTAIGRKRQGAKRPSRCGLQNPINNKGTSESDILNYRPMAYTLQAHVKPDINNSSIIYLKN